MDYLWAPWRIEYIRRNKTKNEECIFCRKASEDDDKENMVVFRGKTAFVLLNLYPYNNGHLMVAPYRHTPDFTGLSEEESREMTELTQLSVKVLESTLKPQGFNIGINLGNVSGAGIADHIHQHIVPRWLGDTNFMPVTGYTKVMLHGLQETWLELQKAFQKLA